MIASLLITKYGHVESVLGIPKIDIYSSQSVYTNKFQAKLVKYEC